MKKSIFKSRWMRLAGWTMAIVMVLIVLLSTIANSSYVEDKLIGLATDALSKELNAKVKIKHISLNLLAQHASIHGVTLKDMEQRDMVKIKDIWVNLRLRPLLRGQLVLRSVKIDDIDLLIVKPEDGPANYQFLIDNPKKKSQHKKKKKGSAIKVDLNGAIVNNIHINYNHEPYDINQIVYHHLYGKHTVTVHHLIAAWKQYKRKGITAWNIDSGLLTFNISDDGEKKNVDIKGLNIRSDNHRPRRNTGKPHHGAFDDGHFDVIVDLSADILYAGKDSVTARLTRGCAKDTIGGVDLTDLKSDIAIIGKKVYLTNTVVQQTTTRLDIPKAELTLPDKKKGKNISYNADTIYGRAILKDISKPFAPVLNRFTIPLNLRLGLNGTDKGMNFRSIHINTDDDKLVINATGNLRDLTDGRKLNLHFYVHDMVAKPGIKDKIVNQFMVKKYMMYQLYALGVIKYHGEFDILWKKEKFRGTLNTEKGDIDFNFEIDGANKYLTGNVSTDSLKLGELFQLKKLGNIDCSASFNIDISKERTKEMRKEKEGKLPIGNVKADVKTVQYRNITLKNIVADIQSDGALASGDITMKGNLTDLMLQFSFTNTNEMQKMKVKPKLKFRKYVEDD
ncbi:MAG: AsmA family protein [Prevotella sp.]|nr:AsmA family protein [Prevotella sp.]